MWKVPGVPGYDDIGYTVGFWYDGEPGSPGVPGWPTKY